MCDLPEIVRFDDRPLARVSDSSELRSGGFLIDAAGRVVIADDPAGHRVEESAAAYAFLSNGARDVTVSGLTVENYGNPAQRGAVFDDQDSQASGWLIEHNDVRRNSGLGVLAGPRARVMANRIEDNGQLGLSANLDGALVEGNEIARNNTRGFDPQWEGGGFKATVTTGLVVRRNYSHDNQGPGLWCDIECRGALYDSNLVENNAGPGIFYEISFSGIIRGNTVRNNGLADNGWYWGANILLAASEGVAVERNVVVVAEGGAGIALIDQGRPRDSGGLYRTADNRIAGNDVRFQGRAEARSGAVSDVDPGSPNDGIIEAGHNRFDGNRYHVPAGCDLVFGWGRRSLDFRAFQAIGQERASEMDVADDG